jgi:ubiquinone/menaquinone biosynthesis C-methylase UbiE
MLNKRERYHPVVTEYRRLARLYDTKWSFYVEATVSETVSRISLSPSTSLLDIGCGTGKLLGLLAEGHPEVALTGVDPVPQMLDVARSRLPARIELREAWAEALPFDDASFDVTVSCSVFHFIRQPRAALMEMRRVLKPGGKLVITDWCGDYLTCRILDRYLRFFNAAHHRIYRQYELSALLEKAGYTHVQTERYKINWLWGLMTVQALTPGS